MLARVDRTTLRWIGATCLLLIIPIKLVRLVDPAVLSTVVGVAPSLLGPPGLLFMLLSSEGRLSRLTLEGVTLVVLVIAVGLELVQLLPRPGILARLHYTFDPLDLGASVLSLVAAYAVAAWIGGRWGSPKS